jgi:hypothetical protein
MNFEELNHEWCLIDGFDNFAVSRSGKVMNDINGRLVPRCDNSHGYLIVNLWSNSKQQSKKIHRLVAEAFLDNPNNLPQVDHIDRNRYNNNVQNLRWSSLGDNQRNKLKHRSSSGKLTASKFKGVSWSYARNKWRARASVNGKLVHCGYFVSETDAANAWNEVMYQNYDVFIPNVLPNLLTI